MAWEAAFVHLASTALTEMAEAAGLRLSFSTERSVQDELARESTSGGWVGGAWEDHRIRVQNASAAGARSVG